jgi:hypothetical protein
LDPESRLLLGFIDQIFLISDCIPALIFFILSSIREVVDLVKLVGDCEGLLRLG